MYSEILSDPPAKDGNFLWADGVEVSISASQRPGLQYDLYSQDNKTLSCGSNTPVRRDYSETTSEALDMEFLITVPTVDVGNNLEVLREVSRERCFL